MSQFGRSEDINEIKVCYESVAKSAINLGNFSLHWRLVIRPMIIRLIGKSFKGFVTKMKSNMERLLASLEAGSMSVPIKL